MNENGNNSAISEKSKEFHGVVADGIEDEWYVYVPDKLSASGKDTIGPFFAWRNDDRLGTSGVYFLDFSGRQRRIYCCISECKS